MIFIYPIQAALFSLGVNDPFILILSGRLVVVLFSAFNLYLVFLTAVRLFKSIPVGLLAMVFLALSKLHTTMGSTELPRTIASTFILISLFLLVQKKNRIIFSPLAGAAIGIGASIRFSEVVFIPAALLFLLIDRRLRDALSVAVSFSIVFILINYIGDILYWGQPFFSLKNIIDYTLVQKASTRGIQPLIFYLLSIGLWTNFFSFGLLIYSLRLNIKKIWVWVATPILFLSLLPHKEPRYLLPVIPFYFMMVGCGTWGLLEKIADNDIELKIRKKIFTPILVLTWILTAAVFQANKDYRYAYLVLPLAILILACVMVRREKKNTECAPSYKKLENPHIAALLVFTLFGAFLLEVGGFYLHKSESGVEMARFLSKQQDRRGAAVEEIWRAGGMLYLWEKHPLENMDSSLISDREGFISKIMKDPIIWVGIRDKSVKRYGYVTLLNDLGFTEVTFSKHIRRETYRLFKKSRELRK
jgi:4-amino-4-deoxy-L-arabinose transferase-like glycosyltransferase